MQGPPPLAPCRCKVVGGVDWFVAVCNVHSRSASPTSQNITMAIAPWGAWLCAALGAGCAGRDGENFAWSATSEDAGKFYVGLVRDVTAPVSAPRPRVSPSRTLRWINLPRTGEKSSLRYALQLMTPAAIVAKVSGREGIEVGDVEECSGLFLDARRSARIVREREGTFVQA
jgi:TIP49 AAA-lid domain